MIGPQLPDDPISTDLEDREESEPGQVIHFLDRQLSERGDRSVIYIRQVLQYPAEHG